MSVEHEYPEVGDLVVASVSKVVDYGAYVKLDEYDGTEGLIHISEISTTWVKNIREHVREGQKLVLKVLRVNPQRGQVDLSLRRVTGRERSEKMIEWKKVKKVESIIKGSAERLRADSETTEKVKQAIYQKYETPYDIFEKAIEEGEEAFGELGISPDWGKMLTEVARSKVKLERANVRATVELTCTKPNGIEIIRSALRNAKKAKKAKGSSVRMYAIGAPKYRIEVSSRRYDEAEAALNQAVDEAIKTIKDLGGEGRKLS